MQTNRSTFGILFYINTSKTKKSGKCPILGRISIDGENTAFSTGLEVLPSGWNANKGMSKGNNSINKQIEQFRAEAGRHYKNMLENKGYVTAETLKNALRGIGTNHSGLMQEFSGFLEEKRKSTGINFSESSYRLYYDGYRHLKNYLKGKFGVDDIPFGKVNISLIEDFAYYLKVELKMAAFSVRTYMKPFRTTVRRAFNRGLLRQDPFFDFTQEKIIHRRRYLSGEELERLMRTDFKRASTNFIRDMFLFSTFTGLSYSDLKNLKHSDIQANEDGSPMLIFKRHKTNVNSCVPLLPIPKAILDKYSDSQFAGWGGKITINGMAVNAFLPRIS